MAKLVCVDPGHGINTPGKRTPVIAELGRSIKEYEFNKPVAYYLRKELERCGFRTMLATVNDLDTPLATRTKRANDANADIYVSIHYNAGGGQGVETYHFPGSSKGRRLAQCIHEFVIQGTPQKNRGVKSANFYVLRHTKMPAALIEFGFMDDPGLREARLMINKAFQLECAQETAKGICKYFGVPYRGSSTAPQQPSQSKPMYDIYVNNSTTDLYSTSYPDKLVAKVKELVQKGTDSIHLYRRDSKNNPKNKK